MSDCKHENCTIDCVCNDCGYDSIVEPMAERYRQQERERIIKLLEDKRHHIKCDCECDEELIALIKGENK